MFKKLVVGVGLFLLGMTVYPSISSAESTRSRPDIVRFGAESGRVGVPTRSVTIDYYGNILPGRNNSDNVGSSTEAFKTGYFGELFASSGIVNVHELFLDLPASDSDSYKANGAIITTTTLIGGGTTFRLVDLTQSDACMNAVFRASFTVGGSTSTLSAGATVYGTNCEGSVTEELIPFGTLISSGAGTVAWALISSVSIISNFNSLVQENVVIYMGRGERIGLSNNINAAGDIYKVKMTTAIPVSHLTVNTTVNTVEFPTVPDGAIDYHIWYIHKEQEE